MTKVTGCPYCNKEPDLPLYCRECQRFFCSDCHFKHLIDYLPQIQIPQNIQNKIMNDLIPKGNDGKWTTTKKSSVNMVT